MSFFDGVSKKIGIDLGTANTLVFMKGKGILINEPSVVALKRGTNEIIAIGLEAKEMLEKTPIDIVTIRPLKDGVIADFEITRIMLKYFIKKALKTFQIVKPIIVIGIPSKVTSVEKRAVEEAAVSAGARKAILIEEPVAAAIGEGIDIYEPVGNMVVDVGGGTTDTAVISLGGIVTSESLKIAGDKMDEAIQYYFRYHYNMMIGIKTAERTKITIGDAMHDEEDAEPACMDVTGRDLVTGLPKKINVKDYEIREAMSEPIVAIIGSIRRVLEITPPELAADILTRGLTLTGGGALLKRLDKLISKETGVPVRISADPLDCVVKGTGIVCGDIHKYNNMF
ncbi:MAG: Rod shape-determining protein MreB [Clostridiales bacterium 38_11]|nr:MAG: Rod shape-determining protein MreB [Clostridiales bacterium 38_11]HBH13047.1 rod shape-determining protein [Clostridiales bacterium]